MNQIVAVVACALIDAILAFLPLQPPAAIVTVFFGVAAVILHALLIRFAPRPIWWFNRLAIVGLVITLIPRSCCCTIPPRYPAAPPPVS